MKKELGQFYTTQSKKILQGFTIPDLPIIEPFCGNGDLIRDLENVECYDVDPKIDCQQRDTLLNPPDYSGKFVITNPPYLARNKVKNNPIFEKFKENDLYKCFIRTLIQNPPKGGVIIIPFNFFLCIRKSDIQLRKQFLNLFEIERLNVFEEQVFDDTSYSVCSFQFKLGVNKQIETFFYPSGDHMSIKLDKSNDYTFGGEIYNLKTDKNIQVSRLLKGGTSNTNITLFSIDDGKKNGKPIRLEYLDQVHYGKISDRNKATIVLNKTLSKQEQLDLVEKFNSLLKEWRQKYRSLFLTNFRESKDYQRKRISFDLVFTIINHLLTQ